MNKKSPIEQERANLIKITRTIVRLKHSVAADNELNDILPDKLVEFDKAVQQGELRYLGVPTVEEVLNADQKA